MRPKNIHDPYRNPFHNRFHVPVHSRLDEMQAYTHMAWLSDSTSNHDAEQSQQAHRWGRALAGAFALVLVVVFSAALLS